MASPALAPSATDALGAGIELRDWRTAETKLGRELGMAMAALARLDERLSVHRRRDALVARLAMKEICDLSWIDGADLSIETLALYHVAHTGGGQGAARSLLRADWAIRRLTRRDVDLEDRNALIGFLGLKINARADDNLMDLLDRALGSLFVHELDTWIGILRGGIDLHPLTRAAVGYQFWKFLELSRGADMIEPAVIAARLGAVGLEALPFVPIATRNRRALHNLSPAPLPRLEAWLIRVAAACEAARRELIALDRWELHAREATIGMSGKTPARLVRALIAHPVVSARLLAEAGKVSSASALRALTQFEELGLTHEVTGKGRFRFWRAAVRGV